MDVVCCDIRVVSSRKRRGERVGVGSRGKYIHWPEGALFELGFLQIQIEKKSSVFIVIYGVDDCGK
jgi:hypothetical protein